MILSLILAFASLDPSLQVQARTHVTNTADRVADQLGLRPVTPKDRIQEQVERTKAMAKSLENNNRKLEARLLESEKSMEVFKEQSKLLQKNIHDVQAKLLEAQENAQKGK